MFASRLEGVEYSGIRKMFDMAKPDIIQLGLGEPDFAPPRSVIDALKRGVENGLNKYTPTRGILKLREAIAERLRKYDESITERNVIVTSSATEALSVAGHTLYDEGDEVLIPDPGFVQYKPQTMLCNGKPVFYPLTKKNHFVPSIDDLESLVSKHTKAIILNYPSNPTGSVLERSDVERIVSFADEHDLVIISDEVYDEFVYEREHHSFLGKYDKVVYINSFSKVFAVTGWRIGYLVADEKIVEKAAKVHYYTIACPPSPAQYAVLEGLKNCDEFVKEMISEFRARRDLIVRELNSIHGFHCLKPEGAFYAFPSFDFSMSSEELAVEILKAGVLCVHGASFGRLGEGHLRFSYANSQDNIKMAMEIIKGVAEKIEG